MAHKPQPPKTRREPDERKPNWKLDRYEQRAAKTIARRNITGGF